MLCWYVSEKSFESNLCILHLEVWYNRRGWQLFDTSNTHFASIIRNLSRIWSCQVFNFINTYFYNLLIFLCEDLERNSFIIITQWGFLGWWGVTFLFNGLGDADRQYCPALVAKQRRWYCSYTPGEIHAATTCNLYWQWFLCCFGPSRNWAIKSICSSCRTANEWRYRPYSSASYSSGC